MSFGGILDEVVVDLSEVVRVELLVEDDPREDGEDVADDAVDEVEEDVEIDLCVVDLFGVVLEDLGERCFLAELAIESKNATILVTELFSLF